METVKKMVLTTSRISSNIGVVITLSCRAMPGLIGSTFSFSYLTLNRCCSLLTNCWSVIFSSGISSAPSLDCIFCHLISFLDIIILFNGIDEEVDWVSMLGNLFAHCLHCHLDAGAVDVMYVVATRNLCKPVEVADTWRNADLACWGGTELQLKVCELGHSPCFKSEYGLVPGFGKPMNRARTAIPRFTAPWKIAPPSVDAGARVLQLERK
ncbi:hypothetical protein PVAP13_8KG279200 [Panicum virgatum]|uniref:Uncharacterized protein n=1 Tax=Panicum virgatum TaxID=38727 RepID=A0A8T0PKS2_PANVG|nr:hypothetical protein PVAP13_8KG279200 [Panicum virgatum]